MRKKYIIILFSLFIVLVCTAIYFFYTTNTQKEFKTQIKTLEVKKIIDITPSWANINLFLDVKTFLKDTNKNNNNVEKDSYISQILRVLNIDIYKNVDYFYLSSADFSYYADYIINIFGNFKKITDKNKVLDELKNIHYNREFTDKREKEKELDIKFYKKKGIDYIVSNNRNFPNIIFYSNQRIIFTNLDLNSYISYFIRSDNKLLYPCKKEMEERIKSEAAKSTYWGIFDISDRVKSIVRKKFSYIDIIKTIVFNYSETAKNSSLNFDIYTTDDSSEYNKTIELNKYIIGQVKNLPINFKKTFENEKIPPILYEILSGTQIKRDKNIVKVSLILTKEQLLRYKKKYLGLK